ncbi:MAG: beta galactosidase jelly roll domain-containing protein [Phycisphaerales bacterium]|nr:MAG: beta galactosidase jelly roll domain-containing protein [Phycisphaerales bacterium]
MRVSRLIVCFLLLSSSETAVCRIRLPRLISDGMVLQRDGSARIWGWAAADEKVTIDFDGKTYSDIAGTDGKWAIMLFELKAGGPHSMEISGSNHISLKDILIGDVWVCSGQSNMDLPMDRVKERYPDVIANSDNPAIRRFFVSKRYDFNTAQEDLQSGHWESANPESVLRFTATGYFFARALYEEYKVPVGLIHASVGGSPAEAWLSEEALKQFPVHLETAEKFRDQAYLNQIAGKDKAVSDAWYRLLQQKDEGLADGRKPWFDPTHDTSDWATMNVPGYWADEDLGHVNGVVWFRKEIDVPASMTGKPARLLLGRVVDSDRTYVNGKFVGSVSYQYPPRKYDVPEDLLKAGKNVIVVRAVNNIGRGGFIPDKPYELAAAGQTIDLKGPWQYKLGAAMDPLPGKTFIEWQPLGLYNGMIAPLLNYTIKGVIWYQGESNTGRPREYQNLFPALIVDWRQRWNQGNFPFLYVQLANYMRVKDQPSESNWAELREAQLKTLTVPNTAMAVTSDIGEWNDVHPLNKEDVGKRLALGAQKVAYGDEDVVYSGPIYQSMKIEGNKIVLTFAHIGSGLFSQGGGELKHFAIAGADKRFVWAKAKIEDDTVVVWNDDIANPVAVRYAWADNPEGANLYNKEGLPASPFRTDG